MIAHPLMPTSVQQSLLNICFLLVSFSSLTSVLYIDCVLSETTRPGDGYKGCLFRAQWDNQFPISRVFQDPRGPNIYLEPPGNIFFLLSLFTLWCLNHIHQCKVFVPIFLENSYASYAFCVFELYPVNIVIFALMLLKL